jgi:predicted transposase/invertase (TIGR01784 family)
MQVAKTQGFEKRAQYYAAKAYVNQLGAGQGYYQLKEIIFLAITDFVLFPEKSTYRSDHVILDKQSYIQDLKDFYFCFIELPKFNKPIDELDGMLEKWVYFLKNASSTAEAEVEEIAGEDDVIRKAYEVLNQYSWSQTELSIYEAAIKEERDRKAILAQKLAEGEAKGKAEGRAEGKAEGKAEGSRERALASAKRMLQKGYSLEEIVEIIELSEEEIASLSINPQRFVVETSYEPLPFRGENHLERS